MRTTINLDDEVAELAKSYAENRSLSLGKAVSELVRRGLNTPYPTRRIDGFLVFDPPPGTPEITTELVKRLEAEEF
ncbi:MAG: antitoxin [Acidobacteria bacterium]|nr:antitoxin [Acidobacteriota bacterium]